MPDHLSRLFILSKKLRGLNSMLEITVFLGMKSIMVRGVNVILYMAHDDVLVLIPLLWTHEIKK